MDSPAVKRTTLLLVWLALAVCLLPSRPAMAVQNDNRLGSVGLQVVPVATGELAVLQLAPGSPAARSGLKPGDLIVQIDDFPLAGSDFAMVVSQHLWGPEGTAVVIHYLRPGLAGRNSVSLRRTAADPKLTVSPTVRSTPIRGAKP